MNEDGLKAADYRLSQDPPKPGQNPELSTACASCYFFNNDYCRLFEIAVDSAWVCDYWLQEQMDPQAVESTRVPLEVYACIRLIAESGAAIPLRLTGTSLRSTRTERLLRYPSPTLTSSGLVSGMLVDLLTEGNAFIRKYRDPDGDLAALKLENPNQVVVELEGHEPIFTISSQRLTRRDVLHVKAPITEGLRGLSPLLAYKRVGLKVSEASPQEVARMFRVPPNLIGLDGPPMELSATIDPWLRVIEEALGADEDLFPRDGGLSPTFQPELEIEPVSVESQVDQSEILAAIRENARQEPLVVNVPQPHVTVEPAPAPNITVEVKGGGEKRVERDELGRISRIVEEGGSQKRIERDEQGQITRVIEEVDST